MATPSTLLPAATPTVDDVLNGLRAGRVCISESPRGPRMDMWFDNGEHRYMGSRVDRGSLNGNLTIITENANGETLRLIGPDGILSSWIIDGDISENHVFLSPFPYYIRAEITATDVDKHLEWYRENLGDGVDRSSRFDAIVRSIRRERRPLVRALGNPIYSPL